MVGGGAWVTGCWEHTWLGVCMAGGVHDWGGICMAGGGAVMYGSVYG